MVIKMLYFLKKTAKGHIKLLLFSEMVNYGAFLYIHQHFT